MKRGVWITIAVLLAVTLLVAAAIASLVAGVVSTVPDVVDIVIGGQRITLPELHGGHWLALTLVLTLALTLALLVALVVVPLAVLLGLMGGLLGLALGALGGVVTLLLVLSPLWLVGGLLWLLLHDRKPAAAGSATADGTATGERQEPGFAGRNQSTRMGA